MLSPDYLLHISEGAEEIAELLHQDIINRIIDRIMARIGHGDEYILTATDKWNIEVLMDAGFLREDILKEIAKRTRLQEKEIREAMLEAGVKSLEYSDDIYRAAGLSPLPLMQSPHLMRLMERNYKATINTWKNFTGTFAEESQRLFINQCDKAYHLVSSGAVSYTTALRESIEEIASNGVVVKYPSGHKDSIETATLRCIRTGIAQATGEITLARAKEMGVNYLITSSHLGARPTHEVWQGKIYSVDWNKLDIYETGAKRG